MYNSTVINQLIRFILLKNGIADKTHLASQVKSAFGLTKNRSVFYCDFFAIRFCTAASKNFGNTVLSLSTLLKYDSIPFFVCLVTPNKNYLFLSNTTFLQKISHSSQSLRVNNIKGSFNGSDILRVFEGIENCPENFESLFNFHENASWDENLERLVEATNNIAPIGKRFTPSATQLKCINDSIDRAVSFLRSEEYKVLNEDLSRRVRAVETEIALAASIDNVNIRGRVIEYLITSDAATSKPLKDALHADSPLPELFTADELGDYKYNFNNYHTATDIKTKVLSLSSCPKGYNIDKLLSFLATEKSVYLVYLLGIDKNQKPVVRLCSLYNKQLLAGTSIIKHWAGRNSRGVTQYNGKTLENILDNFDNSIDIDAAKTFLYQCLES